jgi:hypothetical protein
MDFRSVHGKDDFDDLIGFCVGNGIPMPGSERAMWIVIDRCHYHNHSGGICYWVYENST